MDSEALVDPATVSVIGAVDEQGTVKSPASAAPPEKKPKKEKSSSSVKSSKPSQSKASADVKIAELDQKWSDRFNCLEALLMARTFEPTFSSTVKVTLTHHQLQLKMCLNCSSHLLPLQRVLYLGSLLQSISRPVNLNPADRPRQNILVPTLQLPSFSPQ